MANFGTPTVIGTLSSSTSQTSYVVPITASSTPSGTICVIAGSGLASSGAPQVSSVIDTQNTNPNYPYIQVPLNPAITTNQIFSVWLLPAEKSLGTSDTVTVTFASATTTLKNIYVIDLPGASTFYAVDQAVSNTSSNSPNPSVSTSQLNAPYELALLFEQNSNPGGAPSSVNAGWTQLGTTLHSGSGAYTSAYYQIVTNETALTGTTGNTSTSWTAAIVTLLPNIQPEFIQQPFPVSQVNPAFAFNPALSPIRVQSGQVSPAVTGNINFLGSQSNVVNTGLTNFLTTVNVSSSTFESSLGSWSAGSGASQARSTLQAHSGSSCLALTSTAGGTAGTFNVSGANIPGPNALVCQPNDWVFGGIYVQAASTGRSVQAGIDFFQSSGSQIGSTAFGTTITDAVASWQYIFAQVQAPANAAYARFHITVSGCAVGEVHYFDDAFFANTSTNNQPNIITITQPFWQQFPMAPDGIPYPLSLFPVYQNLPRQTATATPLIATPGVTSTVAVSAPAGGTLVTMKYGVQFPFPRILKGELRYNPAFLGLRVQQNTGNAPTYVDGGPASGQVIVNANFPDMAAVVSVSATTNVNVIAPSPPTIVTGVDSNVNVVAPTGSTVLSLSGIVVNNSVRAPAGSISEKLTGVVSNVAVATTGVVKLGPAVATTNVAVTAPNGSLLIKITGVVSNVAVASTGVAVVTPQGPAANVSVVAPSGTMKVTISGAVSTVAVASTGVATVSAPGPTPNVSVAAPAGTLVISKVISGVVSNVNVASTGIATTSLTGVKTSITAAAPAGSIVISTAVATARVAVAAPAGIAGQIFINGSLVDSDLHMDLLLSAEGKLMEIPVDNILVSASPPVQPQGI